MWFKTFLLTKKKKLTQDIFELSFKINEIILFNPWQFVTFIIEWIWWRAYSILDYKNSEITLIIKRLENWRWWSKFICDLEIWKVLSWVWPTWHFVLQNNTKNKLFLWTGTWFVPLYNMIVNWLKKDFYNQTKFKLIFWTKTLDDLFYIEQLKTLKNKYDNFDLEIYLSREDSKEFKRWYITDSLNKKNIEIFWEFYLCWINSMIDSSIEILEKMNIKKENIFTEIF